MPTPLHAIRVPDDLWDAALRHAQEHDTDVSTAIRTFLTGWIAGRISLDDD